MAQAFQHRVAYIDYHGRISEEGREIAIANERRTTFVRRYLDGLGHDGWELVGIQPVNQHAAYYVFKRHADPASPIMAAEQYADATGAPSAN
jgi:hypothetical protein